MKTVSEKAARELVKKHKDVVIVHTKKTCPVCEYFVPEVLLPIFGDEKYKHVRVYEITEDMTFPVGSHPVTYFFKNGKCVHHPSGSAPEKAVRDLMDTFYGRPV